MQEVFYTTWPTEVWMIKETSLDRFSVPMPSELACYQLNSSNVYEVEQTVTCESCGEDILLEDGEYIESAVWADEYVHNDPDCIRQYEGIKEDPHRQYGSEAIERIQQG